MKKILIGAVLALAVVVFGGNYYYSRQVEKQLERVAQGLEMMGGYLEYRGVSITPGGDVRVNELDIHALDDRLTIDRVEVRTGSILGVHNLAMDLRNKRIPEQLGLSIEGIRLPLGGEAYSQLDMINSQGSGSLFVVGCGDRGHFSARDLIEMGYVSLVMDTHMDYRIRGSGVSVELTGNTLTQGMHDVSTTIDIALGAESLGTSDMGMAMAGAELRGLTLEYRDQGYAERAIEFCREETGLSRAEFLAQYLEAWQDAWKMRGFEAGPNMVAAYRTFLDKPEQLSITLTPTSSLNLAQMVAVSPELLLYQMQMSLEVNRSAAGRFDLTVMDEQAAQAWRAQRIQQDAPALQTEPETSALLESEPETEPTLEPEEANRRPIAVRDLRNHHDAFVELRLTNGRNVEGRIDRLDEDSLQLQSFQHGGSMIRPVNYTDIAEAYLQ